MIRLRVRYTGENGGAYFPGDLVTLSDGEEHRLISQGYAEELPRVTKPAVAQAAVARQKKRMIAAEIRRLGGDVPHHNAGLAKFEAALKAVKDGD